MLLKEILTLWEGMEVLYLMHRQASLISISVLLLIIQHTIIVVVVILWVVEVQFLLRIILMPMLLLLLPEVQVLPIAALPGIVVLNKAVQFTYMQKKKITLPALIQSFKIIFLRAILLRAGLLIPGMEELFLLVRIFRQRSIIIISAIIQ